MCQCPQCAISLETQWSVKYWGLSQQEREREAMTGGGAHRTVMIYHPAETALALWDCPTLPTLGRRKDDILSNRTNL